MHRFLLLCLGVLGLGGLLAPPSLAQVAGDLLVIGQNQGVEETSLPRGPRGEVSPLDFTPETLVVTTGGQRFALISSNSGDGLEVRILQLENGVVLSDQLLQLLDVDILLDAAPAASGGFYLLTRKVFPTLFRGRFGHVDVSTGVPIYSAIGSMRDEVIALAPTPTGGLWAIDDARVLQVNLANGATSNTDIRLDPRYTTLAADTDSSGATWMLQARVGTNLRNQRIVRLDPVTRTVRETRFDASTATALAIARGCQPSATTRCLLGGRFQVEVSWRDFEDRQGLGQVADRGSADSALFYFFDENNLEVLVKMVDGCDANGFFWVFAAGTTDVEFNLEVTDLVTGAIFTVQNPLGQASAAVTSTNAFETCGDSL